jgi:Ssp1 endopeptidase immunity protein Rap1a
MIKFAFALCLISSFMPVPTLAQGKEEELVTIYLTGVRLTENCRSYVALKRKGGVTSAQQAHDAGVCWAFVVGVVDTIAFEKLQQSPLGAAEVCPPQGIDSSILVEVVSKFADDNPAALAKSGYVLTRTALNEKYPCTPFVNP